MAQRRRCLWWVSMPCFTFPGLQNEAPTPSQHTYCNSGGPPRNGFIMCLCSKRSLMVVSLGVGIQLVAYELYNKWREYVSEVRKTACSLQQSRATKDRLLLSLNMSILWVDPTCCKWLLCEKKTRHLPRIHHQHQPQEMMWVSWRVFDRVLLKPKAWKSVMILESAHVHADTCLLAVTLRWVFISTVSHINRHSWKHSFYNL